MSAPDPDVQKPAAPLPQPEIQIVLDLYKLSVEFADRISARRGTANQYFLSLEALILGVPAVFKSTTADSVDLLALQAVGVVIALVWWLQLRSYRQLNTAKFRVIGDIERHYFAVHPFAEEWTYLKADPVRGWRDRYTELGTAERVVPWLFVLLNVGLAARVLAAR